MKDSEILEKIEALDAKWGYLRWPDIMALADQLSNPEEREKWQNTCKDYAIREKCAER